MNRTDASYQTFLIEYGKSMELIKLEKSFMFKRHQNMLVDEVESPIIENQGQFDEFISNPESEKLYESESILIGQTKS